jgi:hypothetical protein
MRLIQVPDHPVRSVVAHPCTRWDGPINIKKSTPDMGHRLAMLHHKAREFSRGLFTNLYTLYKDCQ